MPRRVQIRMACQRCRKKRAKCDGQVPCRRCAEAGEACVYDHTRRESKDDLRAEIDRLRRCNEENDRLFRAIYSIKDAAATSAYVKDLVEGTKSRRAVLQELAHLGGQDGRLFLDGADHKASAASSSSGADDTVCPHCLSRLLTPAMQRSGSVSSDHSMLSQASKATLTPALATPVSLLSFPFEAVSNGPMDRWTRTGWTMASVQHLLDTLLTWDSFAFCLLCKDTFLRDYHSGVSRFCSTALVNALLALAVRFVDENGDEVESSTGIECGSKGFSDEANAIIQRSGHVVTLPNIQAIGILALYQLSCGREAKAQALAEAFQARMTELYRQEPLVSEEYAKVRATSYCGAVSLISIIRLTIGQVFDMSPSRRPRDDSIYLDQPPGRAEYVFGTPRGAASALGAGFGTPGSQLRAIELIPARIFQLTEWVYKLSSAPRGTDGPFDANEVAAVYTKCLDWYEGFFSMLKTDESDTQFVLFIHMYYQFCLLCLFQPLVNLPVDSDVRPREICLQAAQSILGLSQSYSRLFTLGRVSAFVPYFVSASGMAGLTMQSPSTCDGAALVGSQPLPPRKLSLATSSDASSADDFGSSYHDVSVSPTVPNMPIAAHASRLLAEMGSKQRVASPAEKILLRYGS